MRSRLAVTSEFMFGGRSRLTHGSAAGFLMAAEAGLQEVRPLPFFESVAAARVEPLRDDD